MPKRRHLLYDTLLHVVKVAWTQTGGTSAGLQTSLVPVALLSDWGCNSGHLFVETDLHGKWFINAGAWIIERVFPPPVENVCVFTVCHTNSVPRDLCFCVSATSALC